MTSAPALIQSYLEENFSGANVVRKTWRSSITKL